MNIKTNNINNELLIDNLKKNINTGAFPAVNPINDFFVRDVSINSWFAIGHFECEGHTLNYLFHLMTMIRPNVPPVINSNLSITDETTGWYYADDKVYMIDEAEIKEIGEGADKKLSIKVPNGSLLGNINEMHWKAEMPHGKIDVTMQSYGLPIYNGGTGSFPSIFEAGFNQYSVPNVKTTGTLTLDDKTYNVSGKTWFDRQWQEESGPDFISTKWNWSWMDLNLDNGDVLSLWDMNNETYGKNNAWATVQHPDGTQSTCMVEILKLSASDFFESEESKQVYPTKWVVKIPDLQAELEIKSLIKEQEIVSSIPFLHKYEGASSIKGTYKGEGITGYCYVELLGDWKK